MSSARLIQGLGFADGFEPPAPLLPIMQHSHVSRREAPRISIGHDYTTAVEDQDRATEGEEGGLLKIHLHDHNGSSEPRRSRCLSSLC